MAACLLEAFERSPESAVQMASSYPTPYLVLAVTQPGEFRKLVALAPRTAAKLPDLVFGRLADEHPDEFVQMMREFPVELKDVPDRTFSWLAAQDRAAEELAVMLCMALTVAIVKMLPSLAIQASAGLPFQGTSWTGRSYRSHN